VIVVSAPPTMYVHFHKTFDMTGVTVQNGYEATISGFDTRSVGRLYSYTWEFVNGVCEDPKLSIQHEEIYFTDSDCIYVRYPTSAGSDSVESCACTSINCGVWQTCMTHRSLQAGTVNGSLTVYVYKYDSAQICSNPTRSFFLNATINCGDVQPNPSPTRMLVVFVFQ